MPYWIGSEPSRESRTLGEVIDSMTRRLDSVPPDDPAARLLREQLEELTQMRDRVTRQDYLGTHSAKAGLGFFAALASLLGLGGVIAGAYQLATPGHSAGVGVTVLVIGLVWTAICVWLSVACLHDVRVHQAERARGGPDRYASDSS